MRVTNKIIQNNSVNNINLNKTLQDKLNTQMATEKKINRPSEDPVVAIRALRLRTNVSQVTQYYSKNIPDANSWLELTEDALGTTTDVLTDMIESVSKGVSEKLTDQDRKSILDALSAYKDEVYSTGNADYAGRSLFTGYRTESTLMYDLSETRLMQITEQLTVADIDDITYVNSGFLNGLNSSNYSTGTYNTGTYDHATNTATTQTNNNSDIKEQDIAESSIKRIRLAYDNLKNSKVTVALYNKASTADKVSEKYDKKLETVNMSRDSVPSPYQVISDANEAGKEYMVLIPETGELLISDSVYNKLAALNDDITTPTINEAELRITYEKSTWDKGDLRPEHYFACIDKSKDDPATTEDESIIYNSSYLEGIKEKQAIEYDVGTSQTVRVNTTADEVFTHAIGRDTEDLINVLNETIAMQDTIDRLTEAQKALDTTSVDYTGNYNILQSQIDAANKALTYLEEKRVNMFKQGITRMQNHLNKANTATTACGTRGSKLALVENRLMSQKTNFETLESENENVDISEVAIQLKSAMLTYDAALMSTSKVLQTSLMNYI